MDPLCLRPIAGEDTIGIRVGIVGLIGVAGTEEANSFRVDDSVILRFQ